jgi:hypothetical protein
MNARRDPLGGGPQHVSPGHPDFETLNKIRSGILTRVGGEKALANTLPLLIRDALDFVIDPVRTARTRVIDLDNVEKTFIGLKVEHYLRDLLDVPKGLRDLVIDGLDVDVKNTVRTTWMIPPETYRTADPCLLIATADARRSSARLGLMRRQGRLPQQGEPRQQARRRARWVGSNVLCGSVNDVAFPPSRWDGIDMAEFRRAAAACGSGRVSAAFFFRDVPAGGRTHRSIVQVAAASTRRTT